MRLSEAPEGEARKEAARQLLESYYKQVLVDGFYHADPHPGNLRWWNDKIYFLDMGMVGEVEPNVRELMLLLMLAFAQKDARFLSEVVLLLGAGEGAADIQDLEAFRGDLDVARREARGDAPQGHSTGTAASGNHRGGRPARGPDSRRRWRWPIEGDVADAARRGGARSHAEPARSGALVRHAQCAAATRRDDRSPADLLPPAEGQGTHQSDPGIGRIAGRARCPAAGCRCSSEGWIISNRRFARTGRRLGLGLAAGAATVATAVVAASPNGTTLVTTAMGLLAVLLGTALVVDIIRGR